MIPVALLTFRECARRPFPYVAAGAILLLALASRLFLGFSFGAEATAAQNIALSAVFLAGLAVAAFVGTTLLGHDLERGTYALLRTKPTPLPAYLAGRFLGLLATTSLICLGVAAGTALILALFPVDENACLLDASLLEGGGRVLLLLAVLDAAALAASAAAPRSMAPLLLLAFLLAGSLLSGPTQGFFFPDFSLFALDAGEHAPWSALAPYTALFCSIFLVLTYILLAFRAPLRRSG